MYQNHVDGNWQEFADNAQKLNWVQHIVKEIREEGYLQKPKTKKTRKLVLRRIRRGEIAEIKEQKMLLPSPVPFDFYFLYDPQNSYTWN